MRKAALFIILALTTAFLTLAPAGSHIVLAADAGQNVYNIYLFNDDQLLGRPNNDISYWFQIKPGTDVQNDAFVDLYYSHSAVLLENQSYMTVYLNGVPLASRRLAASDGNSSLWHINLPVELIKKGQNEIRINSLQRTTEGLCKDIDNQADWLVLSKNSILHLKTSNSGNLGLSDYPAPFMDYLSSQPVNSVWHLPENPTAAEIKAMLNVAADWGGRQQFSGLPIRVEFEGAGSGGENGLYFGENGRLPGLDGRVLSPGDGLLSLEKPGNGESGYRLYVSGNGPGGLEKSSAVLSHPEILSQMEKPEATISEMPKDQINAKSVGRPGTYALEDLGYQDIVLPGAFHQRTSVVIKHPPRQKVGSSSYIEVHFRHSTAVNGKNSSLTVYINGIPVASTALNQGNSENGVLRVNIPTDQLDKPEWMVEFAFYHDIGAVDCSKRYDEVAWSVVQKDTYVYLDMGRSEDYPSLSFFPYLGYPESRSGRPVTMWLSSNPSEQELTLAALIAARAGQNNIGAIDWRVVLGKSPDESLLSNSPVIIIGLNGDRGRLESLSGKLPVWPDGVGGYKVSGQLYIVPELLAGGAVMEAVNSPWNGGAMLYAVIGADNAALERAGRALADFGLMTTIDGQVCVVSREGEVKAFKMAPAAKSEGLTDRLRDYFNQPGNNNSLAVYAALVGLAIIGVGVTLWVAWRRSR